VWGRVVWVGGGMSKCALVFLRFLSSRVVLCFSLEFQWLLTFCFVRQFSKRLDKSEFGESNASEWHSD
jgi:hypothetical protein